MVTEMVGGAVKLFSDFSDKLHERMLNNINPNSDQNRPIGTEAIVDGKRVYWSGENYGWQSNGSYNKLKNGSEFRAGHIALSRVGSSINRAVADGFSQLPEPIKDTAKDVAGKAVETYQSLPDPVQDTIENGFNTASAINESISQITNISPIITGELLTAGAGKVVSVGGKAVVRYDVPSRLFEAQRDLRGMGSIPLGTPGSVGAASAMKPANWAKAVQALDGDTVAIKNLLSKPYHKAMKGSRFEYISLDDLSKDKGGWLTTLAKRDEEFTASHQAYMKSKSDVKQRKMYDRYTSNPLSTSRQVYDENLLRKAITKSFNEVTGQEWHHIFGNKEAAEIMLTTISQDPYIAVNLFHHMNRLKLSVSGVADNIALMSKTAHRRTGGLHSYQKQLGLENVGKRKGVLELNDYAASISEAVLKGDTDITELFTLLEAYAKLNKNHLRPLIKDQFGGKVLSELKGMEAFIQGQ